MTDLTTVHDGSLPYVQLNTRQPTNSQYYASLSRSQTLEHSIANMTKNFWIRTILGQEPVLAVVDDGLLSSSVATLSDSNAAFVIKSCNDLGACVSVSYACNSIP